MERFDWGKFTKPRERRCSDKTYIRRYLHERFQWILQSGGCFSNVNIYINGLSNIIINILISINQIVGRSLSVLTIGRGIELNIHNASKSELFLSMVSIWWAIVLISSPHLFDNVPVIYKGIADVAGEKVWACFFTFAATIKIVGIAINSGPLRKWGLTLSSLFYAAICAGYIWSGAILHAGTGVYFSMTMLALWRLREVRILYAGRSSGFKRKSKILEQRDNGNEG